MCVCVCARMHVCVCVSTCFFGLERFFVWVWGCGVGVRVLQCWGVFGGRVLRAPPIRLGEGSLLPWFSWMAVKEIMPVNVVGGG